MAQKANHRRFFVISVLLVTLPGGVWAIFAIPPHFVGIHQRRITRELAEWEAEYSTINSTGDAIRTAEMLGYVQLYFPVGDGYRSKQSIEAALEE
jgi:hypothetical protein